MDGWDAVVLLGIIATLAGLALFDWRLALVAAGVVLVSVGVLGARRRARD